MMRSGCVHPLQPRDVPRLHTRLPPHLRSTHVVSAVAPGPASPRKPPPRPNSAASQPSSDGGGPRKKAPAKRSGKPADSTSQRLAKVMAAAGVASRRGSEVLIADGKVAVNGVVVTVQGTLFNLQKDTLTVDGKAVAVTEAPLVWYFAVNKPKGYICSSVDTLYGPEDSRRAIDLLKPWLDTWKPRGTELPPRFFTVGRLDYATYGLLLITNDGHWMQKVIHPSSGLSKEYIVQLSRPPSRAHLELMMEGITVDGTLCVPREVSTLDDPVRLRIVVDEGRTHEVRELVKAVGHTVVSLKRVRIGGLRLDRALEVGQYRELTPLQARMVLDPAAQEKAMQIASGATPLPQSGGGMMLLPGGARAPSVKRPAGTGKRY